MKKKFIIIDSIIILVIIIVVAMVIMEQRKPIPPAENVNTSTTNTANTNTADLSGEPVEYTESMGTVCPLGMKLLGKKGANPIGCTCPEGYEFESKIIGYSSGDTCYGEGSEC